MPKEYYIIEQNLYDDFTNQVNTYLKDGWELHGNLVVLPHVEEGKLPQGGCYIQAVVKNESEPSDEFP